MNLCSVGEFCLVYWEEEEAFSVVKADDVVDGVLRAGEYCSIKIKKQVYSGLVAGVGKCYFVVKTLPVACCCVTRDQKGDERVRIETH